MKRWQIKAMPNLFPHKINSEYSPLVSQEHHALKIEVGIKENRRFAPTNPHTLLEYYISSKQTYL